MVSLSVLLSRAIDSVVLPPGNFLLLGIIGMILMTRRVQMGRALVMVALACGYALSTPILADSLLAAVQTDPGPTPIVAKAGAIVVLGGGVREAPEYAGETVAHATLERLRHAARLQRETAKPILVTGGNPLGNAAPEATLMRECLERDFNVPVAWAESRSVNTAQNASLSAEILRAARIDTVYLVTHAWHMPRARFAFEHAGIRVIPAPVGSATLYTPGALALLPDAAALRDSALAFHEIVGLVWYRLLS
jgi:uncharacterized SAM-binding protein YcdF (DUF218 family)